MFRLNVIVGCLSIVFLSGCVSSGNRNLIQENEQLKQQIVYLNQQMVHKNDEIKLLKKESNPASKKTIKLNSEIDNIKTKVVPQNKQNYTPGMSSDESGDSPTIKQIQICLRNAGYYKGNIDGKRGSETQKAIGEFQKTNGLASDGVVGKKTWEKLKVYLY